MKAKVLFKGAAAERKECELTNLNVTTSDMTKLTDDQINSLECGDVVIKEDASGKHAYIVSYKKDDTGICITYTDASVVETVSYDLTDGHWVYNSTDVTPLTH